MHNNVDASLRLKNGGDAVSLVNPSFSLNADAVSFQPAAVTHVAVLADAKTKCRHRLKFRINDRESSRYEKIRPHESVSRRKSLNHSHNNESSKTLLPRSHSCSHMRDKRGGRESEKCNLNTAYDTPAEEIHRHPVQSTQHPGPSVAEDFPTLAPLRSSAPPSLPRCNFLAVVNKTLQPPESRAGKEAEDEKTTAQKRGWFTSSTPVLHQHEERGAGLESVAEIDPETCITEVSPAPLAGQQPSTTANPSSACLFKHTVSDASREKHRALWLELAREANLRGREKKSSEDLSATRGGEDSSSSFSSWHAVLAPREALGGAFVVQEEVEVQVERKKDQGATPSESGDGGGRSGEEGSDCEGWKNFAGDATELWWESVCSGEVGTLRGMMRRGFRWSELTYGEDCLYTLHLAALCGQSGVLTLLLSEEGSGGGGKLGRGRGVDCVDGKRRTPLLVACEGGGVDCVKTLLVHGACLAAKDKAAEGPLHKVCRGGVGSCNVEFLEKSKGQELQAARRECYADRKRQLAVLKFLLSKNTSHSQLRINGRNRQGDTPLLVVCGQCARLHHSLPESTSQEQRPREHLTQAHESYQRHCHIMVQLLAQAGADPLQVNSAGLDSLCLVAQCGMTDTTRRLLQCNVNSNRNINPNSRKKRNQSSKISQCPQIRRHNPLVEALRNSHDICARVLIGSCAGAASGASFTRGTMMYEKGLFLWGGKTTRGEDSDRDSDRDKDRDVSSQVTPLMAAAIMDNTSMLALLLHEGYSSVVCHPQCSVFAVDNKGFSAEVYSCLFGSPESLDLLLSKREKSVTPDGQRSTESLLETAALAGAFMSSRGLSPPQWTHRSHRHMNNFSRLIRLGIAPVTHKFLRRIASSDKFSAFSETKHLDPSSSCVYGADRNSSLSTHAPSNDKSTQSSVAACPVLQWRHDTMPYPDLMLAVSMSLSSSEIDSSHFKLVPCHSFVLTQHSKCFEVMLGRHRNMLRSSSSNTTTSGDERRINVISPSQRAVQQMLCWMYSGTDVTAHASLNPLSLCDKTPHQEPSQHGNCANEMYSSPTILFCTDLQEVIDLMVLANEFLVTRLQMICEHRIGRLLLEYADIALSAHDHGIAGSRDIDPNMFLEEDLHALALQLRELGEALNLTTLLSYMNKWGTGGHVQELSKERSGFNPEQHDENRTHPVASHELGYLDGDNADFPFILLLLLTRVRQKEREHTQSTIEYLEHFLVMVTDDANNFYTKSHDMLDVLVEAFPTYISSTGPSESLPVTDCGLDVYEDEVEAFVSSEVSGFHLHNRVQRLVVLQSLLLLHFSSLQVLAQFALGLTQEGGSGKHVYDYGAEDRLADRLSNKLYWFFQRHVLLMDMCVDDADSREGRDLLLLLGPERIRDVVYGSLSGEETCSGRGYRVHRAVLGMQGGSGRLSALLRLKHSHHSLGPGERTTRCIEDVARLCCKGAEPTCLRSLLTLLYCNYLPPITFQREGGIFAKFHSAVATGAARDGVSAMLPLYTTSSLSAPFHFYQHMISFCDEYLAPAVMMTEGERQLRSLLRTPCLPSAHSGDLFQLARAARLPLLASSAAVHFLYRYNTTNTAAVYKGGDNNSNACGTRDGDRLCEKDAFCMEVLQFLAEGY